MTRVLVELLQGKHAHTSSFLCVDVSADIAGRGPSPLPHSVWQLVWHMNFWMNHELARISGAPEPFPEHAALSWPAAETPSAEEWQETQNQFRLLLRRLDGLARGDAAERGRVIASSDPRAENRFDTVEEILWQMAIHNSYHLGQVVSARRALGAWPPREGSDTW